MWARCTNPNVRNYDRYGGRGIAVDERWLDFDAFAEDMGPRPTKDHQIERRDNDGPYSKANCVWATRREQNQNRSDNVYIEFRGERLPRTTWARRIGISAQSLAKRVEAWGVERALTTPAPPKVDGPTLVARAAAAGLSESCVRNRVARGKSLEEALSLPQRGYSRR